jgi:hypothetical protein
VRALWRETLVSGFLTVVGALLAFALVRRDPSWFYSFLPAGLAGGRDPSASVEFLRESFGSSVRYEGSWSGDTMTIARVQPRDRPLEPAQGYCRVFYREGAISTVTCVANTRQLAFAANFVTRR